MKNAKLFFIFFISCIYLINSNFSYGQTTSLSYKEKGKSTFITDITFSNKTGNIDKFEPAEYFNSPTICFLLTPNSGSSKNSFKESDIPDILSKITIRQGGRTRVDQSVPPKIMLSPDKKIDKVIITFPKNEIKEYVNFSFRVETFFSGEIKIEEEYFQAYLPQKEIYQQGLSQIDQKDFLGAFNGFMNIFEKGNENLEIKEFSFYASIFNTHIPRIIELFISSETEKYNAFNEIFEEKKTLASLNACDSIAKGALENIKIFDSYLSLKRPEMIKSVNQVQAFKDDISKKNREILDAFEQEKIQFFIKSDYTVYKFDLFVKMISKMLIYKNVLSYVDEIEPLDISDLEDFPEFEGELIGNWKEDLEIYISLINKTIEDEGVVFKEDIMNNLKDLHQFQKQPYYEIISALNFLNSNPEIFQENLKAVLARSSDEDLLEYAENWLLSFMLSNNGFDSDILTQLNQSISLINSEQYVRADSLLNILLRMAPKSAVVWYYSGRVKYHLGESHLSTRFLNTALEIYPEYIAPRKFILNISEESQSFDQFLEDINKAIAVNDNWYFHFKRALAYNYLKMYNEAIAEIEVCININSWDLSQYFLLGDIYLELKDYDKAEDAYGRTVDIDPYSSDNKVVYNEKMRLLDENKRKN